MGLLGSQIYVKIISGCSEEAMNGQTLVKGPPGEPLPLFGVYIYTHQTTPIMWNL